MQDVLGQAAGFLRAARRENTVYSFLWSAGATMDINEIFNSAGKVVGILTSTPATVILSIVGLVLLCIAGALAVMAIKSKPGEMPRWAKWGLFVSLISGMLFSAAGPSLALFYVSKNVLRKMPVEEAFAHLEANEEVKWLIRLISYNANEEPGLGIDKLARLGPEEQLYSFVADYEELAGYTVKEAYEKTGQKYIGGNRVSAIIFPLRTSLYPANARGLLKVIKEVENRKDVKLQIPFLTPGVLNDAS